MRKNRCCCPAMREYEWGRGTKQTAWSFEQQCLCRRAETWTTWHRTKTWVTFSMFATFIHNKAAWSKLQHAIHRKKSRQKHANVWMKTIAAYDQLQLFNSTLYAHTHARTHAHTHTHTREGWEPEAFISPTLQERQNKKTVKIIKDSNHPGNRLFILLPSGKRFRSMMAKTERLRGSLFPQAIRLLNSNSVP